MMQPLVRPKPRPFRQLFLLLAVALVPAIATGFLHPKRPALTWKQAFPGKVRIDDALKMKNVLWVDARTLEEYDRGHIPGAVWLTPGEWEKGIDAFLDQETPDRPIVVYCGSGGCELSQEVADRLRIDLRDPESAWEPTVFVLKGGWEAWLGQ